jgi:hypothetical protein
LLRLDREDEGLIRLKLPFLLLSIDRDEDAYNLIKWWSQNNSGFKPPRSQEGDWIYLTGQDKMEDLFEIVQIHENAHVLALVALKMKNIIQLNSKANDYDQFVETLKQVPENRYIFKFDSSVFNYIPAKLGCSS